MHFLVHTARPDHATGTQVHGLASAQDAGYREAALEFSPLKFARLRYHCGIHNSSPLVLASYYVGFLNCTAKVIVVDR